MKNLESFDKNIDSLTGFPVEIELRKELEKNPDFLSLPLTVIVFDVSGLQKVNRELGRLIGDKQIYDLSEKMRQYLPKDTLFYRGFESEALAVVKNQDEESLIDNIHNIVSHCIGRIYYGVDSLDENLIKKGKNILNIVDNAYSYLRIRQVLNNDSSRSQYLNSFINALEQVDSDTEAHVKRTQNTGLALGKRIGLTASKLAALELLCLLHDIGKITVPLEILNKPGKLTEEEWKVLRSHTEKGYQIVNTVEELKFISESVLYHHERWDGKGYPSGLKENQIPILARIISVVDAYDAMVNDRSYRKALSIEDAKLELKENAGTQFDPYLVEIFLDLLEEHPELAKSTITDKEINVYRNRIPRDIGAGVTTVIEYGEYILDVNYRIIEVGQRFFEYTGYTEEEAVNKLTQFDLIPKEEIDHYRAVAAKEYLSRDYAYLSHPIVRKDGKLVRVNCLGERYYDSAIKAYKTRILIFKAK